MQGGTTGNWGAEFTETRRLLWECAGVEALWRAGHELADGAVLTSVSDVPFEMSLKCGACGGMFWFKNSGWESGQPAQWRLSELSAADAERRCTRARAKTSIFAEASGNPGPQPVRNL